MEEQSYDVVVVGGGAAGLSAATALARARRSVLVVDAGAPRNAPAGHVHNYLAREGATPAELLAAGRAEVAGYGGQVVTGTVTSAQRLHHGFRVELSDRQGVRARRLVVATGLVDELPAVEGMAERWGRDVLHCPYCHGWEVRDQALGILATSPLAVHQTLLWRQWSDDVTLFLHTAPALSADEHEQLAARGIEVVEGEVEGLEVDSDRLTGVRLAGGRVVPRAAVVIGPRFTARSELLTALGVETAEQEFAGQSVGTYVVADPSGATTVPGVWVAGNVTDLVAQVMGAAAAGTRAGAAVNADLVAEDVRAAVAAHRGTAPPEQFWEDFYRGSERVWSGRPNAVLVRVVEPLAPGTALELGSGEGADAVWLARQGWRVTAVDISATALERGAAHAASAGVAERIDWQRHDLARTFPSGTYDLVTAHYLHSPVELPREQVVRAAAAAVAPGGLLLVVGHAGLPPWAWDTDHQPDFPTPDEVLASLDLAPGQWRTELLETPERSATGPDGQTATVADSVVAVRRAVDGAPSSSSGSDPSRAIGSAQRRTADGEQQGLRPRGRRAAS